MMLKQRLKNNIKYPIIFITFILILSTLGCENDDSDFSIRKGRTIAIGATQPIVRDRITFTDTAGKLRLVKPISANNKLVVVKLKIATSTINSSLWLTKEENKLSPRLTHELSTIYAWTIDFFKIQKGDAFKIYYEDRYINNEYIGIGRILASEFTHYTQKFYSFYYKENSTFGEQSSKKFR